MATATMATAAGAAALLYYTLNRRLHTERLNQEGECGSSSRDVGARGGPGSPSRSRVSRRDVRAPATWLETISTLSETLRFTYSETLGKWPIGDLAFGISFLLKRQGHLSVASIYAGNDSVELKGAEATGYSAEDVLMQEPKAGIVGHSLGGGTAALLTYTLREQKEFASSTCVAFAPAACMTWQ
nr:unnamed protein product [Digitaria exilis]